MKKVKRFDRQKKVQITAISVLVLLLLSGCGNGTEKVSGTGQTQTAPKEETQSVQAEVAEETSAQEEPAVTEEASAEQKPAVTEEALAETETAELTVPAETVTEMSGTSDAAQQAIDQETLGNPRSSFGLGSATFLEGKNILVSLFVTTPESVWTKEEQEKTLKKLKIAAEYIEEKAEGYGIDTELIYDWTSQYDLKAEATTDFLINEDTDYMDRLDEEIAYWFETKISYDKLLKEYDARGIVTCVFVNNPGISYAIVYDGTDNEQESMILFTGDYYRKGQEETAAAYAHEILHVFGAHDLYEDAEFTKEVTDYVADTYPNEIMYTVSGNVGSISQTLSPITAYHLGWIEEAEEVELFPQLDRY
ncbi:MAG: hypothetical protein ACI4ED_03555 [Suilimivivens sp.]